VIILKVEQAENMKYCITSPN